MPDHDPADDKEQRSMHVAWCHQYRPACCEDLHAGEAPECVPCFAAFDAGNRSPRIVEPSDHDRAEAAGEAVWEPHENLHKDMVVDFIRDAYADQTAELANLKRAYEHGLKTLWEGVAISRLDRDAEVTDIYEYVIAELAAAKAELVTLRATTKDCCGLVGHLYEREEELYRHASTDPAEKPREHAEVSLREVRRALEIIIGWDPETQQCLEAITADQTKGGRDD